MNVNKARHVCGHYHNPQRSTTEGLPRKCRPKPKKDVNAVPFERSVGSVLTGDQKGGKPTLTARRKAIGFTR
jgi:hypothetical protein